MSPQAEHPSRDELLVMAYVDDELAPDQRTLFEERLKADSGLAREVCAYRELALLAVQLAPDEPTDLEWSRIRSSSLHRGSVGLGWIVLFLGCLLCLGWACTRVMDSELSFFGKCAIVVPPISFGWLLLIRLRDRRRLLAFDPYTSVKR